MKTTPELLEEIAAVMRERPDDWWREFEFFAVSLNEWKQASNSHRIFVSLQTGRVRRRPRTITIAGIEVPEPMREAPSKGMRYWVVVPSAGALAFSQHWESSTTDNMWLERNLAHLDQDSARQHARALILASGGSLGDD